MVGAGLQGKNHLEAFHAVLKIQRVWIQSKTQESAERLIHHAKSLKMDTHYLPIGQLLPNSICNIVTCTPTESIVLNSLEID
ncbi:MAG: hypothetical protein EBS66_14685 [Betaproteobacteria bacterium]|nr:hypothetical protein [Betaproteobacteria bacterium]NBY06679.1 hypothetical protein [Betaproteobacteria bacterium]